MSEVETMEKLYDELKSLNKKVDTIMDNADLMTPEDEADFEEARAALSAGSTKTLDEIEKERGD